MLHVNRGITRARKGDDRAATGQQVDELQAFRGDGMNPWNFSETARRK